MLLGLTNSIVSTTPMASNRFQRAGAIGGRAAASDLQKSKARETILRTEPWKKREYEVLVVLKDLPNTEAIEAAYSEHGLKAMVEVEVSCLGYLVSIKVIQRRDFLPSDVERMLRIWESFKKTPAN